MIEQNLVRRIRHLEITSRRAVQESMAGAYRSVFKGQGIEFDQVREYQPGDDVRSIDWNVTARAGRPFVKRFVEERQLTLLLVIDLSASGAFGTTHKTKNEIAAELCALLAFSAIHNQDNAGLILFTDRVEKVVRPGKGTPHVLRLIRDLLEFKPLGRRTRIASGLDYLRRAARKRCVVFLVSDFWEAPPLSLPADRRLESSLASSLRLLAQRHDLIAISIVDPAELKLPRIGLTILEDAETGELIRIDTNNPEVRRRYEQFGRARQEAIRNLFRAAGIDQLQILTNSDYALELVKFFRERRPRAQG